MDIGFVYFLLALVGSCGLAIIVIITLKAAEEAIRADILTTSEGQHRRIDELAGEIELLREAIYRPKVSIPPGNVKIEAVRPRAADLMKVMDYETSQIAALDEFKEK
jgi:hypothetical protein